MSNDIALQEAKVALDKMYDSALDHAIKIVQLHYNKLPSPEPNHFNNELDKIVGELEQLKNKKV